jgi:hypothetical protein
MRQGYYQNINNIKGRSKYEYLNKLNHLEINSSAHTYFEYFPDFIYC